MFKTLVGAFKNKDIRKKIIYTLLILVVVRSSFIITGRTMDIKDFFSGMFSSKPKNVLQTPYGNFNLAKGKDIKRVQKMVIDLQRTTDALTRKDIKNWRDAWQYAINVDSPSRQRLYDIYRENVNIPWISLIMEEFTGMCG